MSSGCGDVLSLADLQTAKKHQLFEAEVITGKAGGVAGGANIDYATNQVTGQTQKTMIAILRDIGFTPASFDFTTGGTLGVNDRDKVVYDPVSLTWYSWAGTLPKVVPAGTNPLLDANWKPRTDPTLRSDLASNSSGEGASLVGTTNNTTVQQELNRIKGLVTVNIADYSDLKAAIAALPSTGGTVLVPQGNFYAGIWDATSDYMSKANVHIKGVKKPSLNADASALVGGSIIEGRFNVFADNFSVSDIGFDMGKNVCDARYPGLNPATDLLRGGTWDAFAHGQPSQVSPQADRKNFNARNVIGLMYNSAAVGHGFLLEAVNGGFVDNITAIYGVHGIVFKCQNVRAGSVEAHMTSVDSVIFKSDTYALGGGNQVGSIMAYRYAPNCTPHTTPAVSTAGVYFNPETANFSGPTQIGRISIVGAQYAVLGANANSGKVGPDINIGSLNVDGGAGVTTEWAFFAANFGTFPRLHIDAINATNVKNVIYSNYNDSGTAGNIQLTIGSVKATIVTSIVALAAGYQRLAIGTLEVFGAQTAYYVDNTARIDVGKETLTGITTKWGQNPPILGTGWDNFGSGNAVLDVYYDGYSVNLKGLMSAGTGAGGLVLTLPAYLRPKEDRRFIAYKNTGTRTFCLVGVAASGLVTIDDGTAPASGTYISLDGISWEAKQ